MSLTGRLRAFAWAGLYIYFEVCREVGVDDHQVLDVFGVGCRPSGAGG